CASALKGELAEAAFGSRISFGFRISGFGFGLPSPSHNENCWGLDASYGVRSSIWILTASAFSVG
ncbi:MAG: hypothetical protein NT167_15100, partial [Verrucomicrobia bacterium]|nr:hypothetical protein [Verrucomicrobiota bacterium]